jgi:AP-1 complex subunit beta-1
MPNSQDEEAARHAAIQKVAAGQQAENLLDFDDAPAVEGIAPSGIAAAVANTPGVSKVLTSSNPLEDLVDIFGGGGGGGSNANAGNLFGGNVFGGAAAFGSAPVVPAASSSARGALAGLGGLGSPSVGASTGLAGLDVFGSSNLSQMQPPVQPPAPTPAPASAPAASSEQQDDLLGLF